MIERNEGGAGEEVIALYFDEDGLSPGQINEIQVTLNDVEDEIGGVEVKQLITPFDSQEQEELLSSDDGTAMIAVVELNMEMSDTTNIRSSLEESMEASGVPTLLTGSSIIEEDVIVSSEQGLATTEMITVIFVMFILLLVFRSIAAPLVPLITVGASYILAVSLVAFLVEYWNFPVSNFTQIFIVAVLFGIGTDYCILLLTRFKEELIRRKDRVLAMKATFKAVGPTVFYSGITGFIGFAAIGFADFSLYRSAVGVSVGILILLVALWVWVPALCCFLAKSCFGQ
ncbi:MMPL family transporter [Thalassobacillus sp. C254]|uniref:MMPL family transporter n=1 Tax=Thalassobacillus sp. C254 TaxID=1225341 RepID=UPI0006CF5513|nr:MMPL family transporter [Thalassobacillus sp. C254]